MSDRVKKCRLFHDWRILVHQEISIDTGWLFLECKRCKKMKDKITKHLHSDLFYYWSKDSIETILGRTNHAK